jgi:hypothetical protein
MAYADDLPAQAGRTHSRPSFLRVLIRALGVSFLSLISLALALYAYLYLPQVQDLFFDVRPYWYQGLLYWFWFYIVGLIFWALPLVFTARLLLQQSYQNIGVDSLRRYNFFVLDFPKYFVVAAFLIVLGGIYIAASNLPLDTKTSEAEGVLRAYLTRHILLLFGFTAVFAVFLVYRGAFIRQYFRFMERFEKRRPKTFRRLLILFETLAAPQKGDLREMSFHLEELKPGFIDRDTFIAGQRGKAFMMLYLIVVSAITLILIAIHFLSYAPAFSAVFSPMTLSSWPTPVRNLVLYLSDTLWLQRAALLPMLFGAWLPFMALLALLSNRYQFPFIVTLLVVATGTTLFISDGHDARVLNLSQQQTTRATSQAQIKPPAGPAALPLDEAIALWKKNNGWAEKGCDGELDPAARALCPRPIIVAGEGGGSRAGFFLASALGHLQDRSLDPREAADGTRLRRFSDQLFAISSVSGSSAGAAFFVGALQAHPTESAPRLVRALYRQRLWFRNVARPERDFLGDHVTYKDALQAAFSIDYLSPVLVGYLARDVTAISRLPFVLDRAGVLETTWENSFGRIYGWRSGAFLTLPFSNFTPTPQKWSPILLFNATSIETGRRVIVTPLSAEDQPGGKYLFTDSYDLYELFCVDRTYDDLSFWDSVASVLPRQFSPVAKVERCREDRRPEGIDVRLSTAANLGARFPIVSPHANIRDRLGNVTDSLVDGGYFDNSGAVTAIEVASALKRADPKLEPLVLQISSEPEWFPDRCAAPGQADLRMVSAGQPQFLRPAVPDEPDFKPLGTLGSLFTVNATRIARGYQTIAELPDQMFRLNGRPSHELIYVCPQERENIIAKVLSGDLSSRAARQDKTEQAWKSVSLSWWLSPPLQAYLDAQLYSAQNQETVRRLLDLLKEDAPQSPRRD